MAVFITGDTHNAENVSKITRFDRSGLTEECICLFDEMLRLDDMGLEYRKSQHARIDK